MKTAFVICSRPDSKRVPGKCFALLNGKPLIEHLIERCLHAGLPVYLAVPGKFFEDYRHLYTTYAGKPFTIHVGHGDDPLARTADVVEKYDLDAAIRVCHDKVFVDPSAVRMMLYHAEVGRFEYVYSSSLPAGASIEVIRRGPLLLARDRFKKVEHISYAIKAVTDNVFDADFSGRWRSKHRLLVDFPEDLEVIDLVLKHLGNKCSLDDAHEYLDKNLWISHRNRPPTVTVYTCAKNAAKWIEKAMGSVAAQRGFGDMEYLLIDDASTDAGATLTLMQRFCETYRNARVIRNPVNVGLASSSNIALSEARAPYIIRLDADDFFTSEQAIAGLVDHIEATRSDAVYPDNYFGSRRVVQQGDHSHHVGGTLFRTRAANHVRFSEGLRGYEGLDFFVRARSQIKIAYFRHPVFFYRQHNNSMSKTNLEERAKILNAITAGAALLTPEEGDRLQFERDGSAQYNE